MASNERKKQILDHLSLSLDKVKSVSSPAVQPQPTLKVTLVNTDNNRSKRILEHLNLTTGETVIFSSKAAEEERKRQIYDHLRKSRLD